MNKEKKEALDICKTLSKKCIDQECWKIAVDLCNVGFVIDTEGVIDKVSKKDNFILNTKNFHTKEINKLIVYLDKNRLFK